MYDRTRYYAVAAGVEIGDVVAVEMVSVEGMRSSAASEDSEGAGIPSLWRGR